MAPTIVANYDQSKLLELPRELRDHVWELAVGHQDIYINEDGSVKQHPSLLVACQETRDEASTYYYSTCRFHCPSADACTAWLEKVPSKYYGTIKDIRCNFDPPPPEVKKGGRRRKLYVATDEERMIALKALKTELWLYDIELKDGVLSDDARQHLRL